jgi:hypothetical protein
MYGTPQKYPYFGIVMGFVWSHDPKSYVGVSVCNWYSLPCQMGQG